jgi:hypothetical protein
MDITPKIMLATRNPIIWDLTAMLTPLTIYTMIDVKFPLLIQRPSFYIIESLPRTKQRDELG